MVAITVRQLSKRFGSALVLDHIDLEIASGELFFLLGPSGCGKTTLLRHLAGFYVPDSGTVLFDRDDVSRVPAHRRGTGMMFQSYALWPHFTVAENVAFGLEERKRPRTEIAARVDEALAAVQLEGLGERRIQQLSGGQQQRVALARALVVRPKCLLLDEPLSNLDAKLRLDMRAEIRRICKAFGLTGVYVTHDQEEALSMADRLAIMDSGRIVQTGAPVDVYRNPASRMVAEFIGETNLIEGRLSHVEIHPGVCEIVTEVGIVHARFDSRGWSPSVDQSVHLSIRPEALTFQAVDASSNRFEGRLAEATYLGASAQYRIHLSESISLKINQSNPANLLPASGERVTVFATADDIVMLPE